MNRSIPSRGKLPHPGSVAAILAASLTAAAIARTAQAEGEKLEVETTLGALASIAEAIGGEAVRVRSRAAPGDDPHAPPARPSATRPDAVIASGDEQPVESLGSSRLCLAGEGRRRLHVPERAGKGSGARHPGGDSHLWLDPFMGHVYARNVEAFLSRLSPRNAPVFAQNRELWDQKLDEQIFGSELVAIAGGGAHLRRLHREGSLDAYLAGHEHDGRPLTTAVGGLLARARPLREARLVTYHQGWSYLAEAWGMTVVGTLEPRPGLAPTPAHLEALADVARIRAVKVVVRAPHEPAAVVEAFAARIGARVVVLPADVGALGTRGFHDFHEGIVLRLATALEA